MKPSRILLASVFITAVILAMIFGFTRIALANRPTSTDKTIEVYQQREAQYQQLIQQANQQLEQANQKLQQFQGPQPQPASAAAAGTANVAISVDKAEQIAGQAVDPTQTIQKKTELVNFQGKTAYDVEFQKGAVYIDAQTGDILFNGTVPQQIDAKMAVKIASDYLQNSDVLQVDKITFRGAPLFRVIFKSGVMVYLDMTGQITYMLKSGPRIVIQAASSSGGGGGGGGGGSYYDDHEGGSDN